MFKTSLIAVAVGMIVALAAPAASAEALPCVDYFDCGYTMPQHLIIKTGSGLQIAMQALCSDYFDCGYAIPEHLRVA